MSRRRMGNSSFSMETFFAYAFLSDLCHVMCWVLKPGGLFRGISPSCTGRLTSVCHAQDFVRLGPSNQSGPVTTSDVNLLGSYSYGRIDFCAEPDSKWNFGQTYAVDE